MQYCTEHTAGTTARGPTVLDAFEALTLTLLKALTLTLTLTLVGAQRVPLALQPLLMPP